MAILNQHGVRYLISKIFSALQDVKKSFPDPMVEITYSELRELRDSSNLKPGRQYRIVDYMTTTSQENTQSAGHQFDIIVTADDVNVLNEKARAIHHEGDTYFSNSDLNAWEIWYSLDNDIDRFDWASRLSPVSNRKIIMAFEGNNDDDISMIYVRYPGGDKNGYYAWAYDFDGDDMNINPYIRSGSENIDFEDIVYTTSENPIINDDIYNLYNNNYIKDSRHVEDVRLIESKGVIYRMIDEFGNDCPYDFKNIQFARWELKKPSVTPTETFPASEINVMFTELFVNNNAVIWSGLNSGDKIWHNGINAASTPTGNIKYFYTFSIFDTEVSDDIIDMSLNINVYCYGNVIKKCIKGLNNIVFLNKNENSCFCNTFEKNCYDNTLGFNCRYNTFGEKCAENTLGNNCINNTFLFDCHNNTLGISNDNNTFNSVCINNILNKDNISNTFGSNCEDNILYSNCTDNTFGNICVNNVLKSSVTYNTFGNNCKKNTLSTGGTHNTFGNNCQENTLGTLSKSNTFGDDCSHNTFGIGAWYNTLENMCVSNTCAGNNYYNTFGSECGYNTLGTNSKYNTFGKHCINNSFGNYCIQNRLGDDCEYIIFGTGTTQLKDYYRNIIIDNGNKYIKLNCTATTSGTYFFQNVRVAMGINSFSSYVGISSAKRGQTYETLYLNPSSQRLTPSGEIIE